MKLLETGGSPPNDRITARAQRSVIEDQTSRNGKTTMHAKAALLVQECALIDQLRGKMGSTSKTESILQTQNRSVVTVPQVQSSPELRCTISFEGRTLL